MSLVNGIPISELPKVLNLIFEDDVLIYEAYSGFDKEIQFFSNRKDLNEYANFKLSENDFRCKDINLTLHYSDTGGEVYIEKHDLVPDKCDGATYRYTADGWGTINFNIFIEGDYFVLFSLHARDKKEAKEWQDTYPEFGSFLVWEWKNVSKHLKRLETSYSAIHNKLAKKL
ncbi:hypothetical protein [Pseudoalteromonas rhizosphaerae]|uniref:hypothetical protein n=1 Tax=Pseudoalteromonas rhizosphaerae TaxID=2518973 RepID=UPI00384DF8EA